MNKNTVFALIICALTAHGGWAAESEQSPETIPLTAQIGFGPYWQTQPYQGAKPKILPTPVVFFDNRLVYVRWTRVGMYVFGKQNWGISLTAQPRPFGYQGKDSSHLSDMEERHPSWEAGMAIGGQTSLGFAELTFFHDILNYSNGSLVRLELGKSLSSGRWINIPSLYIVRYSDAFNNYYYGVSPTESRPSRPAYEAKAAVNFALQNFLIYKMSPSWFWSANFRADYLTSQITHSPIVDDQWLVSAMVSLMYNFRF